MIYSEFFLYMKLFNIFKDNNLKYLDVYTIYGVLCCDINLILQMRTTCFNSKNGRFVENVNV